MKIKVDVNNVTITKKSDIHKGEYNVNKCIFEFSSEYTKDLIYRAVFSCINGSYYQLILNNECNIPDEVLKEKDVNIELGVYAFILNDDNELELRYSPKPTYFKVENGSYKDGDKTEVPSPTDYEKFLNEFNRNANEKTEQFNDNATQKLKEYNENADERVEEINNKVSDVEKIEDNIEEIEKRVSASEQNAKTSETNAKTSESNAQNSANNASKIETNIISIQEDINASKSHIDSQKESVDNSVKNVEKLVEEATNQANISKEQAEISTTNATQTSADRTAVETIKSDVSSMKTSVEQTKTDTEKIKADTQAIKDDTEALKEETLQAKEEVENSLENERIISDKRYARAIDSEVIEIDNFGQVEVDQDGYMKDIEIESTLPEITQDTREGYNKLELTLETQSINGLDITVNSDKSITLNGTLTNNIGIFISDFKNMQAGKFTSVINSNQALTNKDYYIDYRDSNSIIYGTTKFSNKLKVFELSESNDIRAFLWIGTGITLENLTIKPMLIEGEYTEDNLPKFEQYGVSPSLDYPSEFKNMLNSFSIKNAVDEVEKYNKSIILPENNFLGNFNGYKNYIKDNKLKSNLKIVEFTETLDWTYHEPENKFMCSIPSNVKIKDISLPQLCSHYKTKSDFVSNENEFACTANGFRFHNDNNMSLEEWKTFLAQQKQAGTPLQILYISSNEEETSLDDINLPIYQGINNISIENLKISFKQNMKAIAEKTANSRYPKALKTQVKDAQQAQIYAENPEVENLVIKGAELTQKTREGYNFLKYPYANTTQSKNGIDFTDNGDGSITMNGTATDLANFACQFTNNVPNDSNYTFIIFNLPTDCYANCYSVGPKYGEEVGVYNYLPNPDKTEINLGLEIRVPSGVTVDNITIYPMLVKGKYTRENIPSWEQYGASPSLDYPSEVEITKEQKISIFRKNILDTSKLTKDGTNLAVSFEPKSDGGIKIYGTANNTWVSFGKQTLNVPIKQGTTIYSNYGKTEELMRDNNDIRPFFWFYDKDDKIMNANLYGSDFKVLPKDVYSIQFGIEHFNNGTTYDEDMYIELEISDKRPTQFEKYEATEISVVLENNAIKEYADTIDRENNTQNRLIEELVLTGKDSEDWTLGETKTITQVFTLQNSYHLYVGSNPHIMSNYFINQAGDTEKFSIADRIYIAVNKTRASTVEEFRSLLSQLNESGNPLKIYLVKREVDKIPLSEEIKQELNKFKLYDDLNNIFINNGTLSFKYNKSLLRAFEEQSELSASLLERIQALEQAQVNSVGGN